MRARKSKKERGHGPQHLGCQSSLESRGEGHRGPIRQEGGCCPNSRGLIREHLREFGPPPRKSPN